MNRRRVRFTATAEQHIRREKAWWLGNRDHKEILVSELEATIEIVALLPGVGSPYADAGIPGLRRMYLPKVACHIYYTFNDEEVVVRALWGARRKQGPRLEP